MNTKQPLNSKQRKRVSRLQNTIAYLHYFNKLKAIAVTSLEWEMPDAIDLEYLNEALLDYDVSFFKDEDLEDFVALKSTPNGSMNVYGKFTRREAYGMEGYIKTVDNTNSVTMYCAPVIEGKRCETRLDNIKYYAEQLAEIDRSMIVNIKKCKTPWLLEADPKTQLTVQQFFEDVDDNVPVVQVDSNFSQFVKILTTQVQLIAPDLYALKQSIWQEALASLGIVNSSIEKRERVQEAEIIANNAGTIAQRYIILDPLVRACEKINKMFGIQTSVKFRDNLNAYLDADNDVDKENEDEVE